MRIALTRPQADGERSASILRAQGHDVLVAPLMRIEPVAADLSGDWSAVIVTSANAPEAIAGNPQRKALLHLPVFAVGGRSAEAARAAGFDKIASADGDAVALVQLIARQPRTPTPMLYLAGDTQAADVVGELARRGIAAAMRIVYRAVTAPFPAALTDALRSASLDMVLHYSKRSAENFIARAREAKVERESLALQHLCLSAQVAAPLQDAGAPHIAVAKHPDEAALIELLRASCR